MRTWLYLQGASRATAVAVEGSSRQWEEHSLGHHGGALQGRGMVRCRKGFFLRGSLAAHAALVHEVQCKCRVCVCV